jgi:hypothetical protein
VQGIEQEHHAKLAKFSAPVNSGPVLCFAISTLLHSKPAMPLNIVCLEILHIFPFGWFWSVKGNFGERAKVLEWHKGVRGDSRVLS